MGKPTGFMEYAREDAPASSPKARIQNYNEFHEELSETERKGSQMYGLRCAVLSVWKNDFWYGKRLPA